MKANLDPFPHVVVEDLWNAAMLADVVDEFPAADDERWRTFQNEREGKREGSDPALWGQATRALLDTLRDPGFAATLGDVFEIPDLEADTVGGGYHEIPTGGLLAVHVDFNRHPNSGLYRRLNCLVYLNRDYLPEYGGQLLLGKPGTEQVVVEPRFNTTAIFATSDRSWHGHPTPWAGPTPRRSVAVYYYSPEPPPDVAADHSTVWADGA